MILVTGGTGLLGSHLVYKLLQGDKKVRVLVREKSNKENIHKTISYYSNNADELVKKIEWAEGDILDIYSLTEALKDISEVYHCAANVSFLPEEAEEMMRGNVEGTANVVNACLEKSNVILCHVSSVAALPNSDKNSIITENTHWKGAVETSNYAISKYASEKEVWRGIEEGLQAVIVNPSIIIGPGEWKKSSTNMISASYKGIKFYTEGVAGFIDVRDVAEAMIQLMASKKTNERYILSTENLSFKSFFTLTHSAFGKPAPSIKVGKILSEIGWRLERLRHLKPLITKETARASQQKNYYSNDKIKKVINNNFISIEESVKHVCNLFLKDNA